MTRIIDGAVIAEALKKEIRAETDLYGGLTLAVIVVGNDPISMRYVRRKAHFGQGAGIDVRVFEYEEDISEADLLENIIRLNIDSTVDGLIIQLPLPNHISTTAVLSAIDPVKDPDALSSDSIVDSPVVEAVKEILKSQQVNPRGKQVVVVGAGRLVGRPLATYFVGAGAEVVQITKNDETSLPVVLALADIVATGAGVPGLIRPEYLKEGVVLIDAATSEAGGELKGDALPSCVDKCSIFTPVPGGVGPITLAMLFKNLTILCRRKR
jgi:methylenetetrahydrofolate dehydrogenase (NADP+)/methenyltetrahydrofolate cyclohydrolase